MSDEETTGNAADAPVPEVEQPAVAQSLANIAEMLGDLHGRIAALENPQTPPATAPAGPEPLPEGVTRFFSQAMRELAIQYVCEDESFVNGRPMLTPTTIRNVRSPHDYVRTAQFVGGVLDVTDPALADYLRGLPEFGTDYVEDPQAHRQLSGASVLTGVRGANTPSQPEPALSAVIP